jgi:GNAT superfamily N-acetyltransferase
LTDQHDELEIVVGEPAGGDRRELVDALLAFNREATGIESDIELSAFIRDADGRLASGIYGWIFGATGEVALIWVRDDKRGGGVGSRLLTAFEEKAASLGCRQMVIRTHSFQAPGFYRKHGYVEVAAVDDYPAGYAYHLFRKALSQPSAADTASGSTSGAPT